MKRFLITLLLLFLPYNSLFSQEFSGSYFIQDYDQLIILKLEQKADGKVTGTMSPEGIEYNITGKKQGDKLTGFMDADGESLKITAQFINNDLHLTLNDPETEPDEYDEYAETLVFKEQKEKTAMNQSRNTKGIINGITLTDEKGRAITINGGPPNLEVLDMIEKMAGTIIPDGDYWYDQVSGATGVMGGPCSGFLPAGLELAGPLPADASNGNTGVFVNGRQLHSIDVMNLNQILILGGAQCLPGRWTIDAYGNLGPEGGIPLVNLVQLAMAGANQGTGGGGGDNFWSSRYSFGNESGGSGYVKLPNGGYVGY